MSESSFSDFQSVIVAAACEAISNQASLEPSLFGGMGKKRAWYPLFAHAPIFELYN